MDMKKIVIELIKNHIIHTEPMRIERLNGGTISELYLLTSNGNNYVVKSNHPHVIQSEASFLKDYKEITLVPKLIFVESSYQYLVYSFIDGSTNYARKNKKEILKELVLGLLNQYKPVPDGSGWGWADQPTDSWRSFLTNEVHEAKKTIGSRLDRSEHHFVVNLVKESREEITPHLIHGDCGVHNFLFNEHQQICGVIDPTPLMGEPIYDLIYAFCSSPDDLTKEMLDYAMSHMKVKGNSSPLYEKVMIGLYLRLAACLKHHPEDFQAYLKAWSYWGNVVKKG